MNTTSPTPVNPLTPVTLLTGFLGSGKTTLLNHILKTPGVPETAVLINEFGEVSIDHLLVRESNDNIQVMQNGCVCCSVAGDMVRALRDLYFKRSKGEIPIFSRVVIETTGLADPAPIMHTLLDMPLVAARYVLSGVVTTVDATHGEVQLDQHPEAIKQVAVADRILLTKTDIADAAMVARLRSRLATINPGAVVVETVNGNVALAAFFDTGLYQPDRKTPDVANWLRAEAYRPVGTPAGPSRHNDGIASMSVQYHEPLNWDQLIDVIEMLQAMRGDHLLRIKGIVNVAGEAKPRVLHAVQHTLYPATTLAAWPDADHSTRLVFIVKDLDLGFVRASLDEFLHHRSLQPLAS